MQQYNQDSKNIVQAYIIKGYKGKLRKLKQVEKFEEKEKRTK